MHTNRHLNRRSTQWVSVICLLMFLVVNFAGANAQQSVGGSSINGTSSAVRVNGKIAFTSNRDGNQEIYVMNSDGSEQLRLTNNTGTDSSPAFSPDGRTIAFVSESPARTFAIKLMNADGTNQTVLTPIVWDNNPYPWHHKFSLSWSPDGTRIAFQESGEIFTINVNGSNRVNLTNHPASDIEPSWSPDGSRILFISSRVHYLNMHTMNADGSDVRDLPRDGEFWDMSPDWSPGGDKIVFVVHSDGIHIPILYTANADGTNRQPFDGNGSGSTHRNKPRWSPDASKIVFSTWEYFSNDSEIYVKGVNGGEAVQLTHTSSNFQPSWGPLPTATSTCGTPIDCSEAFVRQHYRDFLNREPDAAGLAFWTNEINACGNDQRCIEARRINVSAAFFLSVEFQGTGYLVERIYKSSYGSSLGSPVPVTLNEFLPDTQQIAKGVVVNQPGWEPLLENNKQAFLAEFVQRSRFTSAYPTVMSPAQFVDKLFKNAGLVPLSADRAAAIDEFGSAATTDDISARARALRRVSENSRLADQEFNRAFVLMQYFGYLRRNPDEEYFGWEGYQFWLSKLNEFHGDYVSAEMVKAFITSGEYRQRFGY